MWRDCITLRVVGVVIFSGTREKFFCCKIMRLRTVRQVKHQQQQHKRRNNSKMEMLSCKVYFVLLLLNDFIRCQQNSLEFQLHQHHLIFAFFVSALQRNLLLLSFNNEPATTSIVQLSAPEAESIVEYFIATMYGGQEASYGNMIESSMIPGSTGMSPSPTILQQQHASDLYSNGSANMIASLRTHSSKFPVSWACTTRQFPHELKSAAFSSVFVNKCDTFRLYLNICSFSCVRR